MDRLLLNQEYTPLKIHGENGVSSVAVTLRRKMTLSINLRTC
jgi:hypothetical protein